MSNAVAIELNPFKTALSVPSDPVEYDKWFRARVQASMAEGGPLIPHQQVMAEMEQIIQDAERRAFAGHA
ncbi:hypothetical protein D3C71_19810 [compost metagenome]